MESANKWSGPVRRSQDRIVLHSAAAGHLRAALEQMDLLLATQRVDVGLGLLVDLLRHLRVVRRNVS